VRRIYPRDKPATHGRLRNHTQAWKKFGARPKQGVAQPENTKRDFCVYHATHKDYTYSDQWVEFLVAKVNDVLKFADLKAFKI